MSKTVATLTDADDGTALELRVGDRVVLQLYENAATGYRWVFEDLDQTVLSAREEGYVRGPQGVGGGGHMQWTLEAKASGTTQVRLKLSRSWEGERSVQKRFAVALTIRP